MKEEIMSNKMACLNELAKGFKAVCWTRQDGCRHGDQRVFLLTNYRVVFNAHLFFRASAKIKIKNPTYKTALCRNITEATSGIKQSTQACTASLTPGTSLFYNGVAHYKTYNSKDKSTGSQLPPGVRRSFPTVRRLYPWGWRHGTWLQSKHWFQSEHVEKFVGS